MDRAVWLNGYLGVVHNVHKQLHNLGGTHTKWIRASMNQAAQI